MVLPYLKEDAVIVFHDTNLHTKLGWSQSAHTNNILLSAIDGDYFLQGNFVVDSKSWKRRNDQCFPNIGGVKINQNIRVNIFSVFNLLTLRWAYIPNDTQYKKIVHYIDKHYGAFYAEYIENVFEYHKFFKKKILIRTRYRHQLLFAAFALSIIFNIVCFYLLIIKNIISI
jgi:hypothetical protein